MRQAYDYVIAGAGSAGCVLAARLCEDPELRVCLVEAGGDGRSLFVRMPAGNGFIFGNSRFDWGYESVPQAGLDGRRIYYPRGKGVGGTSLMNGLIYIRGNARDFDRWQARGLPGWGYADVLPYFKKAENAPHREDAYHGHAGPLGISPAANFCEVSQRFVSAAQQAGAPLNDDFNGARQVGIGRFDAKVFGGQRQSTAATYLRRRPPNLTILTHSRALAIEIEHGRARGIRVDRGGIIERVVAAREVVCSLGAFESPKLLMLSGIGPAGHLRAIGIEPRVDLPGVGNSLQDHPNLPLTFGLRRPELSFARYQRLDRTLWLGLQYLAAKSGPATGPFWSTALFHAFDDGELPDLEVYCTPMLVKEGAAAKGLTLHTLLHPGRAILARGKTAAPGVQFDINLLRPRSRGRVRLASADPAAAPLIDPDFLRESEDVDAFARGVELMRDVARQPALAEIIGAEITLGARVRSRDAITAGLRRHLTTGHHPVATCRIGADDDPDAVLDGEFRVRGVDGLRVVDASAFPDQISGNPNAAVIMLAERAADLLRSRIA